MQPVKGNVATAKKRVAAWDFKCKQQYVTVSKAQKELAAAEGNYQAESVKFDSEMKNLQALHNFLSNL